MERKFGTQDQRRALAHNKLIDATIELIAERGLQGFSLSDVGLRAGVSRALAGHHFKSRAELVRRAVERIFDPGPELVEFGLRPMFDAIRARLTEGAERTSTSRALAWLVASPLPTDLAALREAYRASWHALLVRHLKMAVTLEQARPDLDPNAVAPVLLGQIHGEVIRLGTEGGTPTVFLDLLAQAVARAEPTSGKRGARAAESKPAKDREQENPFGFSNGETRRPKGVGQGTVRCPCKVSSGRAKRP
jgi:AcrR family transcriptional regulator